jgi:hypothetical protein
MNDNPVVTQDVLGIAEAFIQRFCILPEAAYLPLALWIVATHMSDTFDAFPYVALISPMKGCGKTRVLEVLEVLCAKPRFVTTISPASLFRMMEESPTLLLDEVEVLRNSKLSEGAQAILAILNAGHRKGSTVTRCEPAGQDWKVRHFRVYGPKVFAAIGRLPDTLTDRCIRISMQRRTKAQTVGRFLRARTPTEAIPVRESISAWSESRRDDVRDEYENIEDIPLLADREVDLWMPLVAVCLVASPNRMNELKRCALVLCGDKGADDVADSLVLKLMADLRGVWPADKHPMTTESVLKELKELSDSPWGGLNAIELARMLRPFGPQPRTVRTGTGTAKGYLYGDFDEVFSRYLPSSGP